MKQYKNMGIALCTSFALLTAGCGGTQVPRQRSLSLSESSLSSSQESVAQDSGLSDEDRTVLAQPIRLTQEAAEAYSDRNNETMKFPMLASVGLEDVWRNRFQAMERADSDRALKWVNALPIDPDEFYEHIRANSEEYAAENMKSMLSDEDLHWCCDIICETVNRELGACDFGSSLDDIDENLDDLAVVAQGAGTSNAAYVEDGSIEVNMTNTRAMVTIFGDENGDILTLVHETEHLLQSASVSNKLEMGLRQLYGFMPDWDDLELNPLYWSWFSEASAEKLSAALYSGYTHTYRTQIGYLDSLTLCTLLHGYETKDLAHLSQNEDIGELFAMFGCADDEEKQLELLQIFCSIELIQEMPGTEAYFENETIAGMDSMQLIKTELKIPVVTAMSRMFYQGLANTLSQEEMTLEEVMYLLFVWEADLNMRMYLDKPERWGTMTDFYESYLTMQDDFYALLGEQTGMTQEELGSLLERYCSSWKMPGYRLMMNDDWTGPDIGVFSEEENHFIDMLFYDRDLFPVTTIRSVNDTVRG